MKILFVTWNRIGDAVLSTGLLSYLITKHPGARITVACGEISEPIFKNLPGLERIITVRKRRFKFHWLLLYKEVCRERWDLVVDLKNSPISYLLMTKKRKIYRSSPRRKNHKVEQLAKLFGVSGREARPTLWISHEEQERAASMLPPGPNYIVIAPTANWPGKEWPLSYFSELVSRLLSVESRLKGIKFVVLAAEGEKERILPFINSLPHGSYIDLAGRTELSIVPAILSRASLFIGNDSGLMHMATASRIPTIALFGPTNDAVYGPWGDKAIVIRSEKSWQELFKSYAGDSLMRDISPAKVEAAVYQISQKAPMMENVA